VTAAIPIGGLALVGGAATVGLAILRISTRPVVGQALESDVAALLLVSAALLLLGAPALYAVQAAATGVGGLVAHVLLSLGLLLLVLVAATPLLHPSLGVSTIEHPVVFGLGIALTLGLLLTGLVTFQASVLPRPAAGLLLGAMAGFAFVFFVAEFLPPAAGQAGTAVFGVLLALGFGWLGIAVWQLPGR
jgi:hypothetical protein